MRQRAPDDRACRHEHASAQALAATMKPRPMRWMDETTLGKGSIVETTSEHTSDRVADP